MREYKESYEKHITASENIIYKIEECNVDFQLLPD
jgi:hypothetical protein